MFEQNSWRKRQTIQLLIGVLFCVVLDRWSKTSVVEHLALGESLPVWDGWFKLTLVHNYGAAFGLVSQTDPVQNYLLPGLGVMVILIFIALTLWVRSSRGKQIGTSLIISGAIGNIIDRLNYGYVIDFIDIGMENQRWLVFNATDIYLGAGIIIWLISSLIPRRSPGALLQNYSPNLALPTNPALLNTDTRNKKSEFDRGFEKQRQDKHKEAIKHYDKAIRLDPQFSEAYCNRAGAKIVLGEYEEAIKDCNRAIELDPEDSYAYSNRASAKIELGRPREAIEDCNRAIDLNPEHSIAYSNRANAEFRLGGYEEAIEDCNMAIELNPEDGNAHRIQGSAKFELGRPEEAIRDLNEAIELNPKDSEAHNNRGNAKLKSDRPEEAIEDYNRAIDLKPSNSIAYINRGNAKLVLDKCEEAIEDYDKAIALDPENSVAHHNRNIAKRKLDEHGEIVEDYDQSLN